jgi:hypothetical protein
MQTTQGLIFGLVGLVNIYVLGDGPAVRLDPFQHIGICQFDALNVSDRRDDAHQTASIRVLTLVAMQVSPARLTG